LEVQAGTIIDLSTLQALGGHGLLLQGRANLAKTPAFLEQQLTLGPSPKENSGLASGERLIACVKYLRKAKGLPLRGNGGNGCLPRGGVKWAKGGRGWESVDLYAC